MKKLLFFILPLALLSCKGKDTVNSTSTIGQLAEDYVRIALVIGQYDKAFVDAYYGPDSLKPTAPPSSIFPKDSLLAAVRSLKVKVDSSQVPTPLSLTAQDGCLIS